MYFLTRSFGLLFLLMQMSSAFPAEVLSPSITDAPSIVDAVQNQRRGDDSTTSTTSSVQPTVTAPFEDGQIMCRAGNPDAYPVERGNKQHYMEQEKIEWMVRNVVCKDLKENHSDTPDKEEAVAQVYDRDEDDYKIYQITLNWKNGHTCGRNGTVYFDESKCYDRFVNIARKCDSKGIDGEYTNFGGVFNNQCLSIDISSRPKEKDTDDPKPTPPVPDVTLTSTKVVKVTAS